MLRSLDSEVAVKAGLIQAAAVALLSIFLTVLLPDSFFDDYGWVSGPLAWIGCSSITARVLELRSRGVLLGAAVAGLPALIAVLIGVHWLGVVIAVLVFGGWCGLMRPEPTQVERPRRRQPRP